MFYRFLNTFFSIFHFIIVILQFSCYNIRNLPLVFIVQWIERCSPEAKVGGSSPPECV